MLQGEPGRPRQPHRHLKGDRPAALRQLVAGKAIGAPALPFAFNIALTTAALFLVPYALREEPGN